jgi:tRNA pseudouridine38-40 synthase
VEDAPEQRLVKLTLHYDGGAFQGWQVQPGARTVQSELEAALSRLTANTVTVIGAGRTDSGVHATGQVASALVPLKWTASELQRALNAVLPDEIWVDAAEDVPHSFHARYSAIARGYIYRIGLMDVARSPFRRRWCWPIADTLDRGLLGSAAALLIGERAFGSFAKAGQEARGEICVVHIARWNEWRGGLEFRVVANRFLHHMVRYLVGTMVDVARGRRPPDDIDALLRREPAVTTSPPAPAKGLFLARVFYSPEALSTWEMADDVLP